MAKFIESRRVSVLERVKFEPYFFIDAIIYDE